MLPSASEFFAEQRPTILETAFAALERRRVRHYELSSPAEVRQRLARLYDLVVAAAATHDIGDVLAYAESLAEERFAAGFDLSEVQTAFNVLEESIWSQVLADLDAAQPAETLGVVSTVIGAGKDALARRYVSLATQTRVPSLDLSALFSGTERRARSAPTTEP
jgi:hypothetical protein